jgi:MFS family permease
VTGDDGSAKGHAVTIRSLLAVADIRHVWAVGAYSGVVRWLEMLAVGIYVFEVTGSPTLVVVFSLLRLLPMGLFGAFMGALTDRIGQFRTIVIGLIVMTVLSIILTISAWSGTLTLWQIAVGAVLGGFFWTTDLPARRNLMGALSGAAGVASAMSLDAATSNVTRALGPALGGLLFAVIGIEGAFALSALLYTVSLISLARVSASARGPGAASVRGGRLLREVIDGVRFARSDRAIVGTLAVTIAFNVFGWPYTSLIPVVGAAVLNLDPFPVGLLMSTEGIGALLGALAAGWAASRLVHRRIYFAGALLTQVAILALSQVDSVYGAGATIALAGIGAGAFSAMQATLIYLLSPPDMRARMLGVLSVCIGTAPVGYLNIALLADWWGAMPAIAISGFGGCLALVLAWLLWPEIR